MAVRWRSIALITVLSALLGLVLAAPALAAGGTVSGVVSDSISGVPIPGVDVELWSSGGGTDPVATTTAGVFGDYTFVGIAPGAYEIWAGSDSYYWNCASAPFTVTADEAFARDIALDPIPNMSGMVYDEATNPVAGASVTAWWFDSATHDYYECAWTTSDTNGAFELRDIGSGDYLLTVDAVGYFSATYLDRGYFDRSNGTLISVLDTDVTGIDVHLKTAAGAGTLNIMALEFPPGSTLMRGIAGVTGTFTLNGGTPVPYVLDANGTFSARVPAGEYEITYGKPGYYSDSRHATVAADGTGSAFATLWRTPPAITGWVRTSTGRAVAGITVNAYRLSGTQWSVAATSITDASGGYSFAILDPGTYRVGVASGSTDSAGTVWRADFWPGATDVSTADDVNVEYAIETSNVNLTLMTLPMAVSGGIYVTPGGSALSGAVVELLEREGASYRTVAQTVSGADGSYALPGVEGHAYRVKASSPGRITEVSSEATFTGTTRHPSLWLTSGIDTVAPTLTCRVYGNRTPLVKVRVQSVHAPGGSPNVSYTVNRDAPRSCPTTLTFATPGQYDIAVTSSDFSGNSSTQSLTVWVSQGAGVDRIGGANRYDVAVNMASYAKGARVYSDVVVACGEDRAMADPLGAAALASAYDCPVLLTPTAKANPSTIAAIKAMRDANGGRVNVHVVGGAASVPKPVFNALAAARGSGGIERISGANRYDVAYKIAARTKAVLESKGQSVPGVIVVNIENPASFNDALAVSPISAHARMPLIGVKGASVPSEASAALTLFAGTPRYALNSAYLSAGVRDTTGARSIVTGSKSRDVAAVDIAKWGVSNGFIRYETVGEVNKLSDALPAGTVMGKLGGPLLYTGATSITRPTFLLLTEVHQFVSRGIVFGGTKSVSDMALTQFRYSWAW